MASTFTAADAADAMVMVEIAVDAKAVIAVKSMARTADAAAINRNK